jgi:hypothetical protein
MILNDRIPLSSDRTYTDEGYLIVPARIARTGVQEYYAGEMGLKDREVTDTVRVYRPASEVFSSDSLGSFSSKPVTDNHPPVLLDAKNTKTYAVGFCEPDIVKDGDYVKAVLHITDSAAIERVKSGKVELSNGYTSKIEWTPGVTSSGEAYDAIQTDIRGNHIAIVDAGRCGAACRIADSKPEEITMQTLTIDGVDFDVNDKQREALDKLQTRLADAEKEALKKEEDEGKSKKDEEEEEEESKKETSDALKKVDVLQAKLDDALSRIPNAEMLDKLLENRLETRDSALKIVPTFDHKGKDCEAIRAEIVATKCPTVDTSKVSTDYIRARFDMLAEQTKDLTNVDAAINTAYMADTEKVSDIVSEARAKHVKRSADAWKSKTY